MRAALVASTVIVGLIAVFPTGLRTSDDAEMLAAASGFDGGSPSPELLFTHVIIGRVLVGLYSTWPEMPWYGLHLYGVMLVAVAVIAAALQRNVGAATRAAMLAIGLGAMPYLIDATVAVQFTIVASLATLAGGVAFMSLRSSGWRTSRAALAAAPLFAAGLLIRFQAFALFVTIILLALAFRSVATMRLDLRGPAALMALTMVLVVTMATIEADWWAERTESGRPLAYLATGIGGSDAVTVPSDHPSVRSVNDRALVDSWLVWPDQQFAYSVDPDGTVRPGPSLPSRSEAGLVASLTTLAAGLLADPQGSVAALRIAVVSLVGAMVIALGLALRLGDRRSRLVGALFLLSLVILSGVLADYRLPDRVQIPMAVAMLTLTPLVATARREQATPSDVDRPIERSIPRWWDVGLIGLVLVGMIGPAMTARATLVELGWRRERAEAFLEELDALPEGSTVILWLIDSWTAIDPLARRSIDAGFPDTVQVAGWQYVLPYRMQQRRDLGIEDWIGAVADRDDVYLVAEEERVAMLQTLLRERRGRLCTEPEVVSTVRQGRELLVRRIPEVPCQGQTLPTP